MLLAGSAGSRPSTSAIIEDITERRQTAAELRHTTDLLRAVSESTTETIFVKDTEGRMLFANPATLRAIGKPKELVLGHTEWEWGSDPAEAEAIVVNDRRIMDSRQPETVEESFTTPQGTRVFLATKAPYYDDRGQVIGLIGVGADITERKRAEERTHRLYRVASALSAALTPVQAAAAVLEAGFSPSEGVTGSVCMLISPDTLEMLYALDLPPDIRQAWQHFPVDTALPIGEAVVCREALWFETVDDRLARYPATAQFSGYDGAWAVVPLIVGEEVLGVLTLTFPREQAFGLNEQNYVLTLAQQCAQALQRARLYQQEREARLAAEEGSKLKTEFGVRVLREQDHTIRTSGYVFLL